MPLLSDFIVIVSLLPYRFVVTHISARTKSLLVAIAFTNVCTEVLHDRRRFSFPEDLELSFEWSSYSSNMLMNLPVT